MKGKIVQVIGAVVDVEFPEKNLPPVKHGLKTIRRFIDDRGNWAQEELYFEVAQHIGESRVRSIAMGPTDGLVRGTRGGILGRSYKGASGKGNLG